MKTRSYSYLAALFTVISGQIYFRPINTDFRLSLGVVVFSLLLTLWSYDRLKTVMLTTIAVFFFRVFLDVSAGIEGDAAITSNYPAAFFYLAYGLLYIRLDIGRKIKIPVEMYLYLISLDFGLNLIELAVRRNLVFENIAVTMSTLSITACLRAALIMLTFFMIKYYPELIKRTEERKKIAQLVIANAKLNSEIIFLNKSGRDIEEAMAKAHKLYNTMKINSSIKAIDSENPLDKEMLSLCRDIHEIKKDHKRIANALESLIIGETGVSDISAEEVFHTLVEDFRNYSKKQGKSIDIKLKISGKCYENKLNDYLSILGNLIVNSIEAITQNGRIDILIHECGIKVADNGCGIAKDEIPLTVLPGYTTKFDEETGRMSTGIGLSQVHFIVTEHFRGTMNIESELAKGTTVNVLLSEKE